MLISIPLSILTSLAVLTAAWPDHQHHDAGRPRARGRHSGRRRHRCDREYLSADGGRSPVPAIRRRRRRRNCQRPRSFRRLRSAPPLSRCFSSPIRRSFCSPRRRSPSSSRCSHPICCREPLVPIFIDVLVAKEYAQRHPGKGNQDSSEPNAEPERPSRLRGWFEKIRRGFGRLLPAKLKAARQSGQPGFFPRFHNGFERWFAHSGRAISRSSAPPSIARLSPWRRSASFFCSEAGCCIFIGQDYFPQISSSTMTLHVRTRPGMRIETATEQFAAIENAIQG